MISMHVPRWLWYDGVPRTCQLIWCHLLSYMVKLPFPDFFIIQSCFFFFCLKYLSVHILFRIWLLIWTSYLPAINCVFASYSRTQKGYRIMIQCRESLSSPMLHFWDCPIFHFSVSTYQLFSFLPLLLPVYPMEVKVSMPSKRLRRCLHRNYY